MTQWYENRKIALVILLLVVLGVVYFTVRTEVTGRAIGKIYENIQLDREPEPVEEEPERARIFVARKLSEKGLYVKYYNDGNKEGRVCDCFAFGDLIEPEGWVYTKGCIEVPPEDEVVLMLSKNAMNEMHKDFFGESIEEMEKFAANSLGWCLPDQEVDREWSETDARLSSPTREEMTACWEEKGFFVCRECSFDVGGTQPTDCKVVGREFESSD